MKNAKTKHPTAISKTDLFNSKRVISLIIGGGFLLILLCQLFTFEDFPGVLSIIAPGYVFSATLAISLIILEFMALPFLIGLEVGDKVKRISFYMVFLAMILLSVAEILALLNSSHSVIFGATFKVSSGIWSILILIFLWIMIAMFATNQKNPARKPQK